MLHIYMARHGQDQDNANHVLNGHRDEPLTNIGINQAREIAEKIATSGIVFDKIYSSPLQRAYVTAQMIAARLNMPEPEKLPGLIERDFGIMTGVPQSEIEARCAPDLFKTEKVTYFLHPEGAETFPQMIERARLLLKELETKHPDNTILLVAHGDIGKMIYAAYYGLDWKTVLAQFHFGNSELILLSPDSPPEDAHVFQIEQFNT